MYILFSIFDKKILRYIFLKYFGLEKVSRRNWNGNKYCCFCSSDETIQHFFFDCHVAKFLWRAIQFTFVLNPPRSITHLFGNWLRGVGTKLKRQLLVGASVVCWAIWLSRNDVVFDKSSTKTYLQVLYRGTHWLRFWAQLQRCDEDKEAVQKAYQTIEILVMQLFANHGWRFSNRIGPQ